MDSTYTGVYSSTALQISRDLLAGYTDDYLFFSNAENEYRLLLFNDSEVVNGNLQIDSGTLYQITYRQSNFQQGIPQDYFLTSQDFVSYTFYNPDNELVYSSLSGYPHLIAGGDYYAFALLVLACIVCGVCSLWHIFRRVS